LRIRSAPVDREQLARREPATRVILDAGAFGVTKGRPLHRRTPGLVQVHIRAIIPVERLGVDILADLGIDDAGAATVAFSELTVNAGLRHLVRVPIAGDPQQLRIVGRQQIVHPGPCGARRAPIGQAHLIGKELRQWTHRGRFEQQLV
jgi:hypothetical protein